MSADRTRLSAWLGQASRLSPSASLLVLSPGFAQHAHTETFRAIQGELSKGRDCLAIDYRGNGGSEGRYSFGAEEWQDLAVALAWGRERYPRVDLLGFSLGAYTALRCSAERPELVDGLGLVSCPTNLEGIVFSGGAFLCPVAMPFQSADYAFPDGNQFLFRWGRIFRGHPDGRDLAPKLRADPAFLVGLRDKLVFPDLSRAVHAAVPGPKSYTEWPQGLHAERMFLQDPVGFEAWLKREVLK